MKLKLSNLKYEHERLIVFVMGFLRRLEDLFSMAEKPFDALIMYTWRFHFSTLFAITSYNKIVVFLFQFFAQSSRCNARSIF